MDQFTFACDECDYITDYSVLDNSIPVRCPKCGSIDCSPLKLKESMVDGWCFDDVDFPEPAQ